MAAGAAILTVCAFMFLAVALAHYSFGRRKGRVGASFVGVALAASLVLPLVARGPGKLAPLVSRPLDVDAAIARPAATGRVVLIVLDGGSLDFVSTAALEGRLPNFGKILDNGAAMHLATIRPTQPDPVWTTVATGKLPARRASGRPRGTRCRPSAIRSSCCPTNCFAHGLVHFGFVTAAAAHVDVAARAAALEHPRVGGADVGRRQLAADVSRAADAGLPGDRPVLPARCRPRSSPTTPGADAGSLCAVGAPGDAAARAVRRGESRRAIEPRRRPTASLGAISSTRPPFVTDRMYEQVASALGETVRPDLSAVRYRELDTAGHRFLRYAMPREFGDVSPEERRRYGLVLEGAYARVDAIVGRALASLGPDDLLLVVSGFGMEPLTVGKRMLERYVGNAGPVRHPRGRAGRLHARLRHAPSRPGGRAGPRWSTSCPPSSTSWACPWRTTWTAGRGSTCSAGSSATVGR